jgi:hypothetical protein
MIMASLWWPDGDAGRGPAVVGADGREGATIVKRIAPLPEGEVGRAFRAFTPVFDGLWRAG